MKIFVRLFLLMAVFATAPTLLRAETLVYFYAPGCPYCILWERDVGSIYSKTEEASRLTLRKVNLKRAMPIDFNHIKRPTYTPSFVVLDTDYNEVGRFEGYNPEFFWVFLGQLIERLPEPD